MCSLLLIRFDCHLGYKHSGYTWPTMTCNETGDWFWGHRLGPTTCVCEYRLCCLVLIICLLMMKNPNYDYFKFSVKSFKYIMFTIAIQNGQIWLYTYMIKLRV